MSHEQQVVDQGAAHKYRTEIPNLVLKMLAEGEISVHDFTLYCVLKRTAGDCGTSWKNTKTLKNDSNMSLGQVAASKKALVAAKLIKLEEKRRKGGGRPYHLISIIDVWPQNMAMFASSGDELASSQSEQRSSPHEHASSPGELKKNPTSKKNSVEEENARGNDPEAFREAIEPTLTGIFGFATRSSLAVPDKWASDTAYELRTHFKGDVDAALRFLEGLPSSEGWRFRKRSKAQTADWLATVLVDERTAPARERPGAHAPNRKHKPADPRRVRAMKKVLRLSNEGDEAAKAALFSGDLTPWMEPVEAVPNG